MFIDDTLTVHFSELDRDYSLRVRMPTHILEALEEQSRRVQLGHNTVARHHQVVWFLSKPLEKENRYK